MHGDNPRALMLMDSLSTAGYEVVALLTQTRAGSEIALDGIRHITLPVPRAKFVEGSSVRSLLRGFADRLHNAWRLYQELVVERPDLCICHEPDSWVVGLLAKQKFGTCLMVDLREVYTDRVAWLPRLLRGAAAWCVDRVIRFLARRSDGVIHVSSYRADHYQLKQTAIAIVHHRCDPTLFAGVEPKRPPGLERRLVFIHAGPLRRNYAAREILAALESAGRSVPELVLLVVGGGVRIEPLQPLVSRLQNSGRLVVVPYVRRDKVAALIKGADVGVSLVLPVDVTHRLASPTKLFEYMEAGLPVIGSDVPEIHEVLTSWKCGLLVDATKPDEIAAAFIRLATDPSLRMALARNARVAAANLAWSEERQVFLDFVAQHLRKTAARRELRL
jgi:glycosyltransferase involved in cell wall biosynthesis